MDDAMEYHKQAMALCQQADDIRSQADKQVRELMIQAYEMEKMAAEMCPRGLSKDILRQSAKRIRREASMMDCRSGDDCPKCGMEPVIPGCARCGHCYKCKPPSKVERRISA